MTDPTYDLAQGRWSDGWGEAEQMDELARNQAILDRQARALHNPTCSVAGCTKPGQQRVMGTIPGVESEVEGWLCADHKTDIGPVSIGFQSKSERRRLDRMIDSEDEQRAQTTYEVTDAAPADDGIERCSSGCARHGHGEPMNRGERRAAIRQAKRDSRAWARRDRGR